MVGPARAVDESTSRRGSSVRSVANRVVVRPQRIVSARDVAIATARARATCRNIYVKYIIAICTGSQDELSSTRDRRRRRGRRPGGTGDGHGRRRLYRRCRPEEQRHAAGSRHSGTRELEADAPRRRPGAGRRRLEVLRRWVRAAPVTIHTYRG